MNQRGDIGRNECLPYPVEEQLQKGLSPFSGESKRFMTLSSRKGGKVVRVKLSKRF